MRVMLSVPLKVQGLSESGEEFTVRTHSHTVSLHGASLQLETGLVLGEILLTGIPTRIILTSGGDEELLRVALEAARFHGATDAIVLAKPFRRAELVAALTEAVG